MLYLIAHQADCAIIRFGPTYVQPIGGLSEWRAGAKSATRKAATACTCGGQVVEIAEGEIHDRYRSALVGRVVGKSTPT